MHQSYSMMRFKRKFTNIMSNFSQLEILVETFQLHQILDRTHDCVRWRAVHLVEVQYVCYIDFQHCYDHWFKVCTQDFRNWILVHDCREVILGIQSEADAILSTAGSTLSLVRRTPGYRLDYKRFDFCLRVLDFTFANTRIHYLNYTIDCYTSFSDIGWENTLPTWFPVTICRSRVEDLTLSLRTESTLERLYFHFTLFFLHPSIHLAV